MSKRNILLTVLLILALLQVPVIQNRIFNLAEKAGAKITEPVLTVVQQIFKVSTIVVICLFILLLPIVPIVKAIVIFAAIAFLANDFRKLLKKPVLSQVPGNDKPKDKPVQSSSVRTPGGSIETVTTFN